MASKAKKRKGTTKKTTRTTRTSKKTEQSFLTDEIIIWITLAVSILMLISNFGIGGFIGSAIADALSNIFGWGAYVIPFILFGIVTFIISNKGNFRAYAKAGAGVFLFILVCTFLQLIHEVGGAVGNILVRLLSPALGVAGTYIVVLILMIISTVIITGKSAWRGVQKHSERAYTRAREDASRRRELAEVRRAEARERREQELIDAKNQREAERKDRHVEGVSFNTTLAKKSPEVKELSAEPKIKTGSRRRAKAAEKAADKKSTIPDVKPEAAVAAVKEPTEFPAPEPEFVINRAMPILEETSDSSEPSVDAVPDDVPAPQAPSRSRTTKAKLGARDIASEVAGVEAAVASAEAAPKPDYRFPPLSLLTKGKKGGGDTDSHLRETAKKLQDTLHNFGVNVTVTNVSCGPSVTRYELQPEQGVKVSKIVGLTDDIKLNLAAADIRIEAPIPGKAAVGIEVPNKENATVMLRDLLETEEFKASKSKIAFAAGRDIGGKVVVADIGKMPHLLVAGATGSGKSVCINTLIMSVLYEATPDEVKLIMIDPKVVELSVYNGIPHLMIPVVTDPKKAAGALNWAVAEMTKRYELFAQYQVRDLKGYNEKVKNIEEIEDEDKPQMMPQIIIIVDELADLMMVAPGEVEEAICRLAQLARAAGIHLVIATQRPSVNVITGLIKANMPSRIAFSVSSGVDSRTIIDMNGAEKLLGKGDMLFYPSGYQKPARVQGSFVSDKEVQAVVDFLKKHNDGAAYDEDIVNHVNSATTGNGGTAINGNTADERDVYFADAGKFIIDKEKASLGMLQRVFKIGFNRAARIMDQLCEAGVVGEEEGTKPRKVLMSMEEFEQYIEEYV